MKKDCAFEESVIRAAEDSPWITKDEAAARVRRSPKTIQRAWASGELRKARNLPLTRPEWVDEWVEGQQNGSEDDEQAG